MILLLPPGELVLPLAAPTLPQDHVREDQHAMPEELTPQPTQQPEGGAPTEATTPTTAPTPAPEATSGQSNQSAPEADTFNREYVEKLRKESADYRTKAKGAEELQSKHAALEAEFAQIKQALGKLSGADPEDVSPEDQIAAAQAKAAEYEQQVRSLKADNALKDALNNVQVDGKTVQVDSSLTLAVLKGSGALDDLDPTASDYSAQVAQAVSETVAAHPQLRTQVVPRSSGNAATPTDNAERKLTREDLAKMSAAEINKAVKNGKLNHLMNNTN